MRRKFDLAFAMGASCYASQVLRDTGRQFASFPFDWIGQPPLLEHVEIMCSGFYDFIRLDALERHPEMDLKRHICYWDRRTKMVYMHDFSRGATLSEEFPVIAVKYKRRIDRFLELVRRSKTVLVFWLADERNDGQIGESQVHEALKRLQETFPGIRFEFLIIENKRGISFDRRIEQETDDVRRIWFDYHVEGAALDVLGPIDMTGARRIIGEYVVKDYRTSAERKSFAARKRREKYARFGATTWFGYMKGKIKKSLRKRIKM